MLFPCPDAGAVWVRGSSDAEGNLSAGDIASRINCPKAQNVLAWLALPVGQERRLVQGGNPAIIYIELEAR